MLSFGSTRLLLVASLFVANSAATASKPALILVPGTFHRAIVFDEIKSRLDEVGYEHINAVNLPSNGFDAADVERTADVKAITDFLETRLKDSEDVVLVGNSYGATVIMEAVKHFEDRSVYSTPEPIEGEGRILGLIMVSETSVTMCSASHRADSHQLSGYIPTIAEVNYNPPRPDIRDIGAPFFNYHVSRNDTPTTVTWDLDLVTYPPQVTFNNLLDTSAADYWATQLLPSSFKALNATGTYIPYDGKFRTLYVIGKHDNSVSPAFAQTYIDQEGAEFEVETIDGDHVPMLSRPEAVVDIIRRFAEGDVESKVGAKSDRLRDPRVVDWCPPWSCGSLLRNTFRARQAIPLQ